MWIYNFKDSQFNTERLVMTNYSLCTLSHIGISNLPYYIQKLLTVASKRQCLKISGQLSLDHYITGTSNSSIIITQQFSIQAVQ